MSAINTIADLIEKSAYSKCPCFAVPEALLRAACLEAGFKYGSGTLNLSTSHGYVKAIPLTETSVRNHFTHIFANAENTKCRLLF